MKVLISMSLRADGLPAEIEAARAVRGHFACVQTVMRPRFATRAAALALAALAVGCSQPVPPPPATYFVPTTAASPAAGVSGRLPSSVIRAFPAATTDNHPGHAPTMSELAEFGETIEPNGQSAGCNVNLLLHSDAFLDNVPSLQQRGLMNPAITPQLADTQIMSVSMAFALQAAAIAAHAFVQQPSAPPNCHFHQAIMVLVGGAPRSVPMFDFDWNKGIDEKGAWARVLSIGFTDEDANQFMAVAPGFSLAPDVVATIRKENRI